MKKILLSVVAAAAFYIAPAQVVFQSDFETGVDASAGWMGTKSYTPSIAASYSASAYHGTLSAQCTNTSTTSHKRYTTQPLSITNGTSYKINFYAQGSGKVRTAIYKGNNSYGNYNSYITVSSSSWTPYTQTVISDTTSSAAEFIFSVLATAAPNHLLIDSVTITAGGTVPLLSIPAVQTPTASTGDSPYNGTYVKTGGIVTAVSTSTSAPGFVIETSNGGAYSGLYVYSSTYASQVALGDSVLVTGGITEFYGMTEMSPVAIFNKVSSGHPLPPIPAISPINGIGAEQNESVLVKILNAQCTSTVNTYGEWTVNNGASNATIGSKFYAFTPTVNTHYDITGVVFDNLNGSNHYWTLQPRTAADIVVSTTGIKEYSNNNVIAVYPNPTSNVISFNLKNNETVKAISVTDVLGRTVYASNENVQSLDASKFENGVYNLFITGESSNYQAKFVVKK